MEVGDGEEVLEGRTEEGVEERGLVAEVVVVGITVGVVVVGRVCEEVPLPGTVEREEPEPEEVLTTLEEAEQSVVPTWTGKGADCEVAPVLSRSKSPRFWPAATVTTHVKDVPVKLSQEKRAGAEGVSPG